jgi:hypothetical protein
MPVKRKKEKMNARKEQPKADAKRPAFASMGLPDSLRGNPCCTVHDPKKEKELKALLRTVSEKRRESIQG